MKLIIDIPEQMYLNAKADTLCGADIIVKAIKNGIPHETVTEFADRCRECGVRYGKLLKDVEEIREVMGCDADAETKCKMISNILTAKPHYFEEQEPKTGHWIFDDECKEHGHCSRCGYGSVDLVDGEPHNSCPKCGAWMVNPQESEG